MTSAPTTEFFDSILDFLTSTPTPEQIISFTPPLELQERLEVLIEQHRLEDMIPEERRELDEFLRMNHFMKMLKIQARQKLSDT